MDQTLKRALQAIAALWLGALLAGCPSSELDKAIAEVKNLEKDKDQGCVEECRKNYDVDRICGRDSQNAACGTNVVSSRKACAEACPGRGSSSRYRY